MRQIGIVNGMSVISFNPRICKRCDIFIRSIGLELSSVSIHASVKDATTGQVTDPAMLAFQSTHL